MILSAIAAMASNRVIGKNGTLPWDLPEDMKFFRDTTKGHMMLMGRKTFESFPAPLKNRLHVVITRQKDYSPVGAVVFGSIDEGLAYCRTQVSTWGEECFLVGGGELYKEMMPITDRIYLTELEPAFPGDAYFPEFSKSDFKETSRRTVMTPFPHHYVVYDRRKK